MNKSQPNVRTCESRAACDDFWLKASEPSLNAIWDNCEDDVYAELLNDTVNKVTYVRQCFVKTKKKITEE
jgi:hypothetical protein